jgi:hypothetical protein
MEARHWFLTTIVSIIVIAAAAVAVNVRLDIYGLFGDSHGRHLPAFGDDRVAKYLLNKHYVPANFNAILIGTSVSANWNTGRIHALHVYNESLSAANIVEETSLVDHALSQPGIQVALLIVHPYLTNSHRFATVQVSQREMVGALGSLTLWEAYKVRYGFNGIREPYDEYGTDDFGSPKKLNSLLQRMMAPNTDFEIDPIAMTAYRDLVANLRNHGVQIVFIVPPISEQLLLQKGQAFSRYFEQIRPLTADQDKVIDFIGEAYKDFRINPHNFSDGVHLERQGADEITDRIDEYLGQWLETGTLRLSSTLPVSSGQRN